MTTAVAKKTAAAAATATATAAASPKAATTASPKAAAASTKAAAAAAPATTPKSAAPAASAPATATPAAETTPAPVAAPAAEESTPEQTLAKFASVVEKLAAMTAALKELQGTVKALQKEYTKVSKAAAKKGTGRGGAKSAGANPAVKRSPSGFAKPTQLSPELAAFLGLAAGEMKARTEVTRMLNEYIKKNNLQDAKDKRQIVPDAAMKKLMRLKEGDALTYFNLQTHIKHHFVKTA
jgi:chromatin remodeling complex protein RSC6